MNSENNRPIDVTKGRKTPSLAAVRKAFIYDPASKTLLRKTSKNGSKLKRPKPAGTVISSANGCFCQIGIEGRQYPAEIIAYMLHTGKAPASVRCLNGDRLDMSPENLLEVDPRARLRSSKGISRVKNTEKWAAYIYHPVTRKKLHLSTYESRAEAEAMSWFMRGYINELMAGELGGQPPEIIEDALRARANEISDDPCGAVDRIYKKLGIPPIYARARRAGNPREEQTLIELQPWREFMERRGIAR